MANKKSKKPFKFFTASSLGVPANIAVGPLGFQAALDANPKGERIVIMSWLEIDLIRSQMMTVLSPPGSYFAKRGAEPKNLPCQLPQLLLRFMISNKRIPPQVSVAIL